MAFAETKIIGNVINIRQAGPNNKVITISQYTKPDAKSPVFQVMTFSRQADVIAQVEAALAAHREETGNENAALRNVEVIARVAIDQHKDLQLQLNRVSIDKTPVKVAKAEA